MNHVTKRYGDRVALDDVSFTLQSNRIYGLLGPNGAGKSTIMNILTGCLAPSEGTVTVNGHDLFKQPLAAKQQIGYLPERPPLYGDMTVGEYLDFIAEAKGIRPTSEREKQVNRVMEATNIADVHGRIIKNLSKGYGQRVGIAQALLGDPSIIILDEPMVGLDPRQVVELRALIRELAADRTVLISSHILSEISEICDGVIILSEGRVAADDELATLEKNAISEKQLQLTVKGEAGAVCEALRAVTGVTRVNVIHDDSTAVTVTVHTDAEIDVRDAIFFAMADKRYAVVSMEEKECSLEKIFMTLTQDGTTGEEDDA